MCADAEITRPEEGPFLCSVCGKPVNLESDCHTDEQGKVVHEACYLLRLMPVALSR